MHRTLSVILNKYQPDACVVQCGADSIVSDPLGGTNLLPEDLAICVERILSWDLPTIFLGGGKSKTKINFNKILFLFSVFFLYQIYINESLIFGVTHQRRLQFSKCGTILDIFDINHLQNKGTA